MQEMASDHRIVREPFAEVENVVLDLGSVIIELQDVVVKMREVGTPEVVAHRGARAARVDVACTTPCHDIIELDGTEIKAVASHSRGILDGLMQLRT